MVTLRLANEERAPTPGMVDIRPGVVATLELFQRVYESAKVEEQLAVAMLVSTYRMDPRVAEAILFHRAGRKADESRPQLVPAHARIGVDVQMQVMEDVVTITLTMPPGTTYPVRIGKKRADDYFDTVSAAVRAARATLEEADRARPVLGFKDLSDKDAVLVVQLASGARLMKSWRASGSSFLVHEDGSRETVNSQRVARLVELGVVAPAVHRPRREGKGKWNGNVDAVYRKLPRVYAWARRLQRVDVSVAEAAAPRDAAGSSDAAEMTPAALRWFVGMDEWTVMFNLIIGMGFDPADFEGIPLLAHATPGVEDNDELVDGAEIAIIAAWPDAEPWCHFEDVSL